MARSASKTALVIVWLVSMSWLFATKILPGYTHPGVPEVSYLSPTEEIREARWDVFANRRRIGKATTVAKPLADGRTSVKSTLRLDRVPIDRLFRQLFGSWAKFLQWMESVPKDFEISLNTTTWLELDAEGALETFRLELDVNDLDDKFSIDGTRDGDLLQLLLKSHSKNKESSELLRTSLPFPAQAMSVDAFSPHPKLSQLRPGQRWRFESYQPFPPGASARTIEAHVVGEQLMMWQGDVETVFLVEFRDIGKRGPTASASTYPTGKLWVRTDGTVLKQQAILSSLQIEFHRLPNRREADSQIPPANNQPKNS